MSCGCALGGDAADRAAIAGLMCACCVHRRGDLTDPLALCTIDGTPVAIKIIATAQRTANSGQRTSGGTEGMEGGCPLGRHPDARGVVVLNEIEHQGLPFVVWFAFRFDFVRRWVGLPPRDPAAAPLPGCHCVRRVKVNWRLVRRWMRTQRAQSGAQRAQRGIQGF